MAAIFSWFLIPAAAALAAGSSNWLTSNFSVAGSESPGSFFLILWALLTGGFFRFLIRRPFPWLEPAWLRSGKRL